MTDEDVKARLTHVQATACTMLAEAGGDNLDGSSVEERIGVGCAIRNRVKTRRFGDTFRDVCLRRKQFSCWTPSRDQNHRRLMAVAANLVAGVLPDPILVETLYLAEGVIGGAIMDSTHGATHYYAPKAMRPKGSKPGWVFLNGKDGPEHDPTAIISGHRFYQVA